VTTTTQASPTLPNQVPHRFMDSNPASERPAVPANGYKVWIDLDNSPHVPFFLPIIEELETRGYQVLLTARDAYQVRELLDLYHLRCEVLGRHYGKNKLLKVMGTCLRAVKLAARMIRQRPDIGVSHGSRSQLLACFVLRIPNLTMFDYEFTSTTRYISPTWAMVPEVVATADVGYTHCPVLKYPGIKEDVYLSRFKPNRSLRQRLGASAGDLLVMVRPPATEAHYHNPESEVLLREVLLYLMEGSQAKAVILPRNKRQAEEMRRAWAEGIAAGKLSVLDHVEDGLNLIWNADLVVSGGGTMNREAAAMGVPVYSIFRGKIGAVDRYLVGQGKLVLLEAPADVRKKLRLVRRHRDAGQAAAGASPALITLVENIASMAQFKRPAATQEKGA
jgi:uncharacterized protein